MFARRLLSVALTVSALGLISGRAAANERGRALYERTLKGTGLVWVHRGNAFREHGTCWVVDASKRWVITNHHVAKPGDKVRVSFPKYRDGELLTEAGHYTAEEAIKGRVLRSDSLRDLALIELERLPEGVSPIELADRSPRPGDELFLVGNPGPSDARFVLSRGNVRTVLHKGIPYDRQPVVARMIETDVQANGGDSGSPVVNEEGKLVGVHSGGNGRARGIMSWEIDVSEVRRFLANDRAPQKVRQESGRLTAKDAKTLVRANPKTGERTESHHKVFTLQVEAGATYVIDLNSRDFDAFLRLEDASGKKVFENDDGFETGTDARIAFRPVKAGTYRIVTTSYHAGKTGAFTLTVHKDR
jgi:S1-C subfamily serine protease